MGVGIYKIIPKKQIKKFAPCKLWREHYILLLERKAFSGSSPPRRIKGLKYKGLIVMTLRSVVIIL